MDGVGVAVEAARFVFADPDAGWGGGGPAPRGAGAARILQGAERGAAHLDGVEPALCLGRAEAERGRGEVAEDVVALAQEVVGAGPAERQERVLVGRRGRGRLAS